jgi:membrane-associated protein
LAGIVKVRPIVFFMFNVVGAFLWPLSIVSAGYYVGKIFPNALDYLNYIIIGFIVVTSIPVINSIRNDRKLKKAQ